VQYLIKLDPDSRVSLQQQLRQQIANAILDGYLPSDRPLPSSRKLATQLGIARNTVMLAYEHLVDDGFLIARQRSGYFVNPEVLVGAVAEASEDATQSAGLGGWERWIRPRPSEFINITKPRDWQHYRYCFIYGQVDASKFPTRHWRECWRDAVTVGAIREWSMDSIDRDDELLVEQIRTRLLPRRGVRASNEEILVTVGAQHALYLTLQLLLNAKRTLGVENPGYVDVRNIAAMTTVPVKPLAIDSEGLIPDESLADCDCVYVTPSHQSPTTVTMPKTRRKRLLELAEAHDFLIIEDDYEPETRFDGRPEAALKSMDRNERVIYVGSLSKTLAPGLRLGYLVGPPAFIREARALRRLMLRHPASNNQRAVALFLSRGYHDSLLAQLRPVYEQRSRIMQAALAEHLPGFYFEPGHGGSSVWVVGPEHLDAHVLADKARTMDILIETGDIFFYQDEPPRNCFRLAYSSISTEDIEPGIAKLGMLARQIMSESRDQ